MSKKFLLGLFIGSVMGGSGAQSYSICINGEDNIMCRVNCVTEGHCAKGKFKSAALSEKHCPPMIYEGQTCHCQCID
jgi:hypothetical protein